MSVYKAINAVQAALSQTGIAKDRINSQGSGYKFRGIDDVFNAISPLLAKAGLCIIPRMIKRESVERQSKNGGALFYVTVEAEFDFVCAEDGTMHTARTFGEAMDSGDKATNKAMSAAYKYAAFQTFAIPTEGDNDADAHTHQVAASVMPDTEIAAWIEHVTTSPDGATWKARLAEAASACGADEAAKAAVRAGIEAFTASKKASTAAKQKAPTE
jgi:hypothetical protein